MRSFMRAALATGRRLWRVVEIIVLWNWSLCWGRFCVMLMLPPKALAIYEAGTTPIGVIAQLSTFALYALALVYRCGGFTGAGSGQWSGRSGGGDHLTCRPRRRCIAAGASLPAALDALQRPRRNRPLIPGWRGCPSSLVLLIQTGTEELYFRGYLQQQFAADLRQALGLDGTAVAFVRHRALYERQRAQTGWLYVFWATLLGLACADLTARTGNIGAAIGLHLSNNSFAFVLVACRTGPHRAWRYSCTPFRTRAIRLRTGNLAEPGC